ncbi:uncharacterized protein LOC110732828 [Chenopodium quinoa]|uniref:uncharacterized protein LOC110732828 n=1 Tax=Chenopodium quinoa TaxID=63459 RepID=UPI000B773EE3|nr:uncharacterized protein LOC110732828 [Chenopodium quinoa]
MMSIFKIPEGLIDEIHSLLARFWWGSTESSRKMHWHNLDSLCLPKYLGGMGFRDLKVFNQALLAKQIWRLHTRPNTLTHAILKAKYFKNSSVLEAYHGYDLSYSWRCLWGSKSLLLEGLKWRVGNGVNIQVWKDAWLPGKPPTAIPVHDMNFDPELRVLELINEECGEWRGALLQSLFSVQDRNLILQLPISYAMPEDKLLWWPSKNGEYTVKSGYWLGRLGHVEGLLTLYLRIKGRLGR